MRRNILRSFTGLLVAGGMLMMTVGCSEDPTVPEYAAGDLSAWFLAGPTDVLPVAHGSKVTFKWTAVGGAGNYSATYQIDSGPMIAVDAGQTVAVITDPALLTAGAHYFKLTVTDGASNSVFIQRRFEIGAVGTMDTDPPTVTITYPPAGYVAAPGSTVRFAWEVDDASNASEAGVVAGVDSVGWALDDPNVTVSADIPLAGAVDNVALGTHTLYVKAVDASGNATVETYSFDVIAPTIFVIDETVLEPGYDGHQAELSPSGAYNRAAFFETIASGYSYEVWDVASDGYPITADIPASAQVIMWIGSGDYQSSSWGYNVGWEYSFGHSDYAIAQGWNAAKYDAPNIITDAIDAGLKVWIMGENWLDELPFYPGQVAAIGSLEYDYLGFAEDVAPTGCYMPDWDANAVVYDLAPISDSWPGMTWPALSSDIAKLPGGLGDFAGWSVDVVDTLRADVTPIYNVSGMSDPMTGTAAPASQDNWYCAWAVADGSGDPQVVMMTFDIYYFSIESARAVTENILSGLFGQ